MSEDITDPSPERAARDLYEGTVQGGPLDGEQFAVRVPRGLVAVDKLNGTAWIYDFHAAAPATVDTPMQFAEFVCRDAAGMTLDQEAAWVAAEGIDFDVVAVG